MENDPETRLWVYVTPCPLLVEEDKEATPPRGDNKRLPTESAFPASWYAFLLEPGQQQRPYREYKIRIEQHTSQVLAETQMRFSVFYERFVNDGRIARLTRNTQHLVPHRGHVWDNYTTYMPNVKLRAQRMQTFLNAVLNHELLESSGRTSILDAPALHKALQLDETARAQLLEMARQRRVAHAAAQAKQAARLEQARREAQQEEQARRALEVEMWQQAQGLHQGANNNNNADTQIMSLRFAKERTFELHTHWFTAGNGTIYGGGTPARGWFALRRTDFPQLNPFADITYQLLTIQTGVVLLEMKERFRMFDYMCDLFYVQTDGTRVPAARVHRQVQFGIFGETYDITGLGANRHDQFKCEGMWENASIRVNGSLGAQMHKHILTLTDGYSIRIYPQQDCLLIVGVCCAISRIHAAIRANSNSAAAI